MCSLPGVTICRHLGCTSASHIVSLETYLLSFKCDAMIYEAHNKSSGAQKMCSSPIVTICRHLGCTSTNTKYPYMITDILNCSQWGGMLMRERIKSTHIAGRDASMSRLNSVSVLYCTQQRWRNTSLENQKRKISKITIRRRRDKRRDR